MLSWSRLRQEVYQLTAPPDVGPGVNHGCPQTWYQLYLAYALDANLASRAHHFLSLLLLPLSLPSHIYSLKCGSELLLQAMWIFLLLSFEYNLLIWAPRNLRLAKVLTCNLD